MGSFPPEFHCSTAESRPRPPPPRVPSPTADHHRRQSHRPPLLCRLPASRVTQTDPKHSHPQFESIGFPFCPSQVGRIVMHLHLQPKECLGAPTVKYRYGEHPTKGEPNLNTAGIVL